MIAVGGGGVAVMHEMVTLNLDRLDRGEVGGLTVGDQPAMGLCKTAACRVITQLRGRRFESCRAEMAHGDLFLGAVFMRVIHAGR
jgi:hypothetical protein